MWRIDPAGDRALLIRIGSQVDPHVLSIVLAIDRELSNGRLPGLVSTVPSYASLLCRFDPSITSLERAETFIRDLETHLEPVRVRGDVTDISTTYDGEDLEAVADATGLSIREVVELHASREYLVYCIGFAPGFTYCGEVDPRLVVRRKASPRPNVPAGSVAIAGRQTGIYAVRSPGGWNLIGHTELKLFDASADPPSRFKPGERLRFVPVR